MAKDTQERAAAEEKHQPVRSRSSNGPPWALWVGIVCAVAAAAVLALSYH